MNKTYKILLAAGVGVMLSSASYAITGVGGVACTDSVYGTGGESEYDSCRASDTRNQSGTIVTSADSLAVAAQQTTNLINSRIDAIKNGGNGNVNVANNGFSASTGLAGGENEKYGVWINSSWTVADDDVASTAYHGDVFNVMGGFDYQIRPRTIIGISVGYESVDLDTEFNRNFFSGNTEGSYETDGWLIAPYVAYDLNKYFTASLTGGYGQFDIDSVRYDNAGTRITGATDSDRLFASAVLAGTYPTSNNWRFGGDAGLLWASEDIDGYTESNGTVNADKDIDFAQFALNGRVGYQFRHFEPYVRAGLEYDISKDDVNVASGQTQANDDDFGGVFGAGFRFNINDRVTGGLEATTTEFRDDYEEYTGTANLRIEF